ncbi:aldehyde dehydrogenase [Flavitalea sp. BT771]|uniref:aldehyde dehydrogenase n=1 Tax=Flavitalea sp. BT771 TaxID=3063329 RepID=UPI0026E2CE87|nr:aldehyde dehydrogenase [Flavitalea sp. BT771]MDO6434286.1 aldehyde dehydrogenase [Flavitalea sp. BT771]MDV6223186.1 aldehyde dehydrogenase [Flavitalea sp. BT771]
MSIDLPAMRRHFQSGATRSYDVRRKHLLLLRESLLRHEQAIAEALYADLKKGREEVYGTETGLVLAELNNSLRHLRKWMRPRRAGTNMVNLPSSSRVYHDPLGVVLIIAPWNYPLQLALVPLIGALAGGNCAVVKPSEHAPATSALIEKMLVALYPPEYVCVVQGEGAGVVTGMMQSFRFDHVFFTGSIPVGRAVYQQAAKELVPVTLELGGKSPVVVEADADVPTAARRIVLGKFINAGQTCIAPDYLLVHADVRDRLMHAMQETMLSFYGARPEESNDYAKIIHERRFDTLVGYLSEGKIVSGGRHDRTRLFIEPTLMEDVSPESALMREEIFGPILPVFTYRNMEEALAIVRQHPDPLAFYLFTRNAGKQRSWMEQFSFGGGCINNTVWHFANHHLPFGGVGYSGMGAYHGKNTFDVFTHAKPVMQTPVWIDPSIKYPPYEGKLKWFRFFFR